VSIPRCSSLELRGLVGDMPTRLLPWRHADRLDDRRRSTSTDVYLGIKMLYVKVYLGGAVVPAINSNDLVCGRTPSSGWRSALAPVLRRRPMKG